jgi:hypothetical protein
MKAMTTNAATATTGVDALATSWKLSKPTKNRRGKAPVDFLCFVARILSEISDADGPAEALVAF